MKSINVREQVITPRETESLKKFFEEIKKIEDKKGKEEISFEEEKILSVRDNLQTTSLSKTFDNDDSFSLIDVLEDSNSHSPVSDIYEKEKEVFTTNLLNFLDARESFVFKNFYGLNNSPLMNLREIGKELGVSHTTAGVIRSKAFYKLKSKVRRNRKIKENYLTLFTTNK